MIIHRKETFFLGIFIFRIPFLGLPTFWKTVFIIFSGLVLVALSIKIVLPKKIIKSRLHREKKIPVFTEDTPVYPVDDTIEKSG